MDVNTWINCSMPVADLENPGSCSRCLFPTPADAVQHLIYERRRYTMPLCDRHADDFHRVMLMWARCGTILTAPSRSVLTPDTLLVPARVEPALVPTTAAPVAPASLPVQSAPVTEPAPQVRPRWDRSLPLGHEEWTFTEHALQRGVERSVTRAEALWCALCPDTVLPGRRPDTETHVRGNIAVVVNPVQKRIVTVIDRNNNTLEPTYAS